ncbi:hypothetical protein F5B20DRAFT_580632 [Whalleya microplaca]|nr:hypothetical protein F5B20DRAFT_580632 [Whalleya microplaca]
MSYTNSFASSASVQNKPSYEELAKTYEDLKLRYSFLLKEKNSVSDAYEKLREKADDQYGLDELEVQLELAKEARDSAIHKNNQNRSELLKVKGMAQKAEGEIVALKQENEKQKGELAKALTLKTQNHQLWTEMKKLKARNCELEMKANKLLEANQQLQFQNQNQQQGAQVSQAQYVQQLEQQLQQAQIENQQGHHELQKTQTENQQVQHLLQQAQSDNKQAKDQLFQLQEILSTVNQKLQQQQQQQQNQQQQHWEPEQEQKKPQQQTEPMSPCRARKLQAARRQLQKMKAKQQHAARKRGSTAQVKLQGEFCAAVVSDAERYLAMCEAQLEKKLEKKYAAQAKAQAAETEKELYEQVLARHLEPPPTTTTTAAAATATPHFPVLKPLSTGEALEAARAEHQRVREAALRVYRNRVLIEDIARFRVDMKLQRLHREMKMKAKN